MDPKKIIKISRDMDKLHNELAISEIETKILENKIKKIALEKQLETLDRHLSA